MHNHVLANRLRRVSSTAATSTAFTAKTPTATTPTGNFVLDLRDEDLGWATPNGPSVSDRLLYQPYGSNANNEDYHMRVYGWSLLYDATLGDVWVPSLIAEHVVTLGNIAATALGTNYFLPDTITLAKGSSALVTVVSPGADLPGYVVMATRGVLLVEFDFDLDAGGSPSAAANVLVRGLSGGN